VLDIISTLLEIVYKSSAFESVLSVFQKIRYLFGPHKSNSLFFSGKNKISQGLDSIFKK
jgi:hypothetical protein